MSTIMIRYKTKEKNITERDGSCYTRHFDGWIAITECFDSEDYEVEIEDDGTGYFLRDATNEPWLNESNKINARLILDLKIGENNLIVDGKTIWAIRKMYEQ